MNTATRSRLRAAVLALPMRQREQHLAALAGLLHLLDHCSEARAPLAFVAGYRAYRLPTLRWAAEVLGRPWIECPGVECTEPDHVTLTSKPVGLLAEPTR